jgi:hypothetical protein
MKKRCSLAQAIVAADVVSIIEQLIAGKLRAFGDAYGEGLPDLVPPAHFAIPLREDDVDDPAASIPPGYVCVQARGGWLVAENDYDEQLDGKRVDPALALLRPRTCLDLKASAIYEDGELRWSNLWLELDVESADKPKRGPPEQYDWPAYQKSVYELMDYHGDFAAHDKEWNSIGKLEKAILTRFPQEDGGPVHSTLHSKLTQMVERWREKKRSE